jgi:hypothetical protein
MPAAGRATRTRTLAAATPATALQSLQNREDRAACGFARFQVAVGLLHLLQRITLIDTDLDFAAGDGFKQVICHLLRALAGGDVGEQGLAGHIQRALAAQHRRREWRYRAG